MDQRLLASDLVYLAPELTLVISAVIISLLDLFLPARVNRTLLGWLTIAGLAVTGVFVGLRLGLVEPIELLYQSYRIDNFANLLKLVLLSGTGLIIFMSLHSVKKQEIPHLGEYYYLYLPAVLGAMIMVSSGDLITLFVGLELLSITSYILVALKKKDSLSNEGAFKYVVLGAISSAILLYGMSFLYGLSGSTNLTVINAALAEHAGSFGAMIYVAFFMLLAGFGFKMAAAPFHAWAPDVYQGAPTPVAAFLAVVSKLAAVALLFRLTYVVFYGVGANPEQPIGNDIFLALGVLAAVSMIAGNVMALRQKNMKRLLAYSGIANSGYLLVPIASGFSFSHASNFSEFFYYGVAYLLMNLGAFAVLMMVEATNNTSEIKGFAGLYYRAPWTAFATVLIMLSLAGLPITAGFFGKLFIVLGTIQTQAYWLAAIMVISSVISYVYYFSIVRQMFMRTNSGEERLNATLPQQITLWFCAIGSVLLGIFPGWIIRYAQSVFELTRDLFMISSS